MNAVTPPAIDARSVFISDTHMGYAGSDLLSCLDFLRRVRCRYLFLNGDIVDSWKLEEGAAFPPLGDEIFTEIAIKHLTGTKVIFLPGNHDDLFREVDPWARESWARHMGLKIRNTYVHKGADGRRHLVLHGDQFDAGILRAGLSRWSDKLWVEIGALLPRRKPRDPDHKPPFSLARELAKKAGKKALTMLNRLHRAARRRAHLRGTDTVICGHTHIPVIRDIGGNVTYMNSGTWQGAGKNHALIEDWDGSFRLVAWDAVRQEDLSPCTAAPLLRNEASRMAGLIRRWIERVVRQKN